MCGVVTECDSERPNGAQKLSMQGGDLFDRLIEKKKFSEAEAKIVFMQLLLGVKYLHDAGIAHRDLKVNALYFCSQLVVDIFFFLFLFFFSVFILPFLGFPA